MHINLDKAVIRVPLLGINNLEDVRLTDLSAVHLIERLKLLCTPVIIEALYISSPAFTKTLKYIIEENGKSLEYSKLLEVWLTFVKYYTRMCSRGTPYGLMASVGTISLNKETESAGGFEGSIHVQLDNGIVADLSHNLQQSDDLLNHLIYYPNPSIYLHAHKLKYIEVVKREGDKQFAVSKVAHNPVIEKVLNYAVSGKRKHDLVDYIKNEFADIYDPEDIEALISSLISNQILLNNYSSSSTKKTLFSYIADHLGRSGATEDKPGMVSFIDQEINKIRKQDWSRNEPTLRAIEDHLERLGCPVNGTSVFHVNFIRSFSNSSIGANVIDKIRSAVELTAAINENYRSRNFETFKSVFAQRYENRFVPLTEVLDEEIGLGFPIGNGSDPQVDGSYDGIYIPNPGSSPFEEHQFNASSVFLFNKIAALSAVNGKVLNLTIKEMKEFAVHDIKLPATYSVFCSLLGKSAAAINQGNFEVVLSNTAYNTASGPINRFSVSDVEIEALCREIFEHEKELMKDKIVAEVLHTPNSRIENINFRTVTRDFELPIESLSSHGPDQQIKMDEILVNVVNNNVKLICRKSKKEIIPKISNNHHFNNSHAHPAYRFFGEVQLQEQQNNLLWHWGPLVKLNFLPRVVLDQQIICSLATWRVQLDKSFFDQTEQPTDKLRDKLFALGLPKWISVRQNSDNLLVLDIEDTACLLILMKQFKKYPYLILHEYLSTPGNSFLKDSEGNSFINELVIPYLAKKTEPERPAAGIAGYKAPKIKDKRSFFPGGEFLYLKIYCSRKIGQQLLLGSIYPMLFGSKSDGDPTFFVRYEDPEFHIRLRVRKEGNELLMPKIHQRLDSYIKNKFIYKIQYDTYHRELDRYAQIPYGKTEMIFAFDSKAILELLKHLNKKGLESITWIIAIKNIHAYLLGFGMELEEMLTFCKAIRTGFFVEFGLEHKDFLKSMNVKLKNGYTFINSIITENDPDYQALYSIFSARQESFATLLKPTESKKIKSHYGQLSSYIHMSTNRLFSSDQRLKEAMSYDLLYNYLLAQKKGYHKSLIK